MLTGEAARLPQASGGMADTAALDVAGDVREVDGRRSICGLAAFWAQEGLGPGLFRGHHSLDLVERDRLEAKILEQPVALGKG